MRVDLIPSSTTASPHVSHRTSRATWRQADDGLWVASLDGDYLGLVTSHPAGYEVSDRFARPVGYASTWPQATALLDVAAAATSRAPAVAGASDIRPRRDRRGRRGRVRGSAPEMREDIMATGTVKWFNTDKGFGFIAPSDGSGDVFAHYREIVSAGGYRTLEENQRVEFDVTQGPKGPQATNIRAL